MDDLIKQLITIYYFQNNLQELKDDYKNTPIGSTDLLKYLEDKIEYYSTHLKYCKKISKESIDNFLKGENNE